MIQRVQSLYLLSAIILVILVLFLPLAHFTDATGIQYKFTHNGLWQLENNVWQQLKSTFWISVTVIITVIVLIMSIFSFQNRKLQMKECWMSIGLILILILETYLLPKYAASKANLVYEGFPWAQILPVISIILVILALKAIKKDDELVKSADRLR